MACISPITAYRASTVNPSGKRSLVFNRAAGFADLPVTIPCGMCIGCRIQRARSWALRCVHESKGHTFNSFVTLTYDDEHLPPSGSIEKSILQLFFKRLRKAGFSFRYFAAGEYGPTTNRPHYHILFFGIDFHQDRRLYKTVNETRYYKSEQLNKIWGQGDALITGLTYTSAEYVAKYIISKRLGKDAPDHSDYSRLDLSTGEHFQVLPEFTLMSRRPGIGSEWYAKFASDAFPSDFLVYDERKFAVPRYYSDKLKNSDATAHAAIKKKRRIEQWKNKPSEYQLEAKKTILAQRVNSKQRSKI